jgi:hypothetical protein
VDDTKTGTSDDDVTKDPVPLEEKELTSHEEAMVKRMEYIIQFFLDLLQVTGGDSAPEKSSGISLHINGIKAHQHC